MDLNLKKPLISICVPAYNRAQFLRPLIDSVMGQKFTDYEVVICEDKSPEREAIVSIINDYNSKGFDKIKLILNETNLGYDGNIRKLAREASGEYCFYLGNDDLLNEGALNALAGSIINNPSSTLFLRSYAWFSTNPKKLDEKIYYFSGDRTFTDNEALRVGFRRAGVISGFIIKREVAVSCETDKYDGSLYYQMHLAINALKYGSLFYVHRILTLSRSSTAPDFGNSQSEKGVYTPGSYTTAARINMFSGAIRILKEQCTSEQVEVVLRDYANHFYPYIKDQLHLPPKAFYEYYCALGRIGFSRFFMFHFYCFICYLTGERLFDVALKYARRLRNCAL